MIQPEVKKMKKKLKQISLGVCAIAMMCGCGTAAPETSAEKTIEETAAAETEPETVRYDQSETHEASVLNSDEEITGGRWYTVAELVKRYWFVWSLNSR